MVRIATGWMLVSLLLVSGRGIGAPDPVQLKMRAGFASHVLWQNVEAPPYWEGGVRPASRPFENRHAATLAPGRQVLVRVPPREKLKLIGVAGKADAPLSSDDLSVSVSDGSGLHAFPPLAPSSSAHETPGALLLAPDSDRPLVARIERPSHCQTPIALAIYVSMTESPGELAPYRDAVPLPGQAVVLEDAAGSKLGSYRRLRPQTPLEFQIQGPIRLKLENRLKYPASESQRRQSFRIAVRMDGRLHKTLTFETLPDMADPIRSGGVVLSIGQLEAAYIDVPAGRHQMAFVASADLYVRLLTQGQPDYLAPRLNAPTPDARAARNALSREGDGIESTAAAALRTARDNRVRDGGAAGTALMESLADQWPDEPDMTAAARKMAGVHTFFRSLPPDEIPPSAVRSCCRFLPRRLKSVRTKPRDVVASTQHAAALLDAVPSACFIESDAPLTYLLPERFAPGVLRILALAPETEPVQFALRMDDGPLLRFTQLPGPEFPMTAYDLSLGDIGLALARIQDPEDEAATLGGVFGADREPGPLVHAGVFETALPVHVRSVRIEPLSSGPNRPAVALQYRTSATYSVSESAYYSLMSALAGDDLRPLSDVFLSYLSDRYHQRETATPNPPEAALRNQWTPLVRLLCSRARPFAAEAVPPSDPEIPSHPLTGTEMTDLIEKAEHREAQEMWVQALETWTALFHGASGDVRRKARFGRIRSLEALGEFAAAERMLTQQFFFADSADSVKTAFHLLKNRFLRTENDDALVALYTLSLVNRRPGLPSASVAFREIGAIINRQGDHRSALLIALMADGPDRDPETLLRAAFHERWRRTFDDALQRLPSEENRHLWMGHRECRDGRREAALAHYRQAGPAGRRFADFLQTGMTIRRDLNARGPGSMEKRTDAATRWAKWRFRHPGPFVWRDAAEGVVDAAGERLIYSPSRDLYAHGFLSQKIRPARLRVVGPAVVRVEIRPLHPAAPRTQENQSAPPPTPLEGWVYMETADERHIVPINRNLPSGGLRLVDGSGMTPGHRIVCRWDAPPGTHDLAVYDGDFPAVVRFYVKSPDIPINVLPPLTPETLAFALGTPGDGSRPPSPEAADPACCGHPAPRLIVLPVMENRPAFALRADGLYAGERRPPVGKNAALALAPLSMQPGHQAPETAKSGQGIYLASLSIADAKPAPPTPGRPGATVSLAPLLISTPGPGSAIPEDEHDYMRQLGRWLADGQIESALRRPPSKGDDAIRRYMALLAWVAERRPERYGELVAKAESYFAAHARVDGLKPILNRINRNAEWILAPLIQSSAGIRHLPMEGWAPQAKGLRIRKALMPPFAEDEHVLYDDADLVFYLSNLKPTELTVSLRAEDAGDYPPTPMRVRVALDESQKKRLSLIPGSGATRLALPVSRGEHALRVGIDHRSENQFLRVRVHEAAASGKVRPFMAEEKQRAYHVATHEEPMIVDIEGPAWVRIDTLRNGDLWSRYRLMEPGWQTLSLLPEPGAAEALFRVFQKVPATEPLSRPAIRVVRTLQGAVPPPDVPLPEVAKLEAAPIREISPIGGQENGTTTWTAGWRRRSRDPEGASGGSGNEDFFEFAGEYRHFDDHLQTYFQGRLLGRLREIGGPTFGAASDFRFDPYWLPFRLHASGQAFWQQPEAFGDGHLEASIQTSAAISRYERIGLKTTHAPTLRIFGRYLSLPDDDEYGPERVDGDVFTPYKRDHRLGLRLSDTLSHRPWLDTLWQVGGRMVWNEDFNPFAPDHFTLTAGWKQALGNVYLHGHYRFAHYFEDNDRDADADEHRIAGELVWEKWFEKSVRLEIALSLSQEFPSDQTRGAIRFSWHRANGRGYRDFTGTDIDFKTLRKRKYHRLDGPPDDIGAY